jgi:PAS domain S-box-containing protein
MSLAKEGVAVNETNPSYYVEWQEPPELTLDERGMIRDCSKSGERLFGYRRHNLVWQHVSMLFPQLSGVALVQEERFNPQLNFLCHCGKLFQSQDRQGETFFSRLSFVSLENDGRRTLRLIVHPSDSTKS